MTASVTTNHYHLTITGISLCSRAKLHDRQCVTTNRKTRTVLALITKVTNRTTIQITPSRLLLPPDTCRGKHGSLTTLLLRAFSKWFCGGIMGKLMFSLPLYCGEAGVQYYRHLFATVRETFSRHKGASRRATPNGHRPCSRNSCQKRLPNE